MAKSKTSKRYTREFRRELVALHRAGRSIPELSREFGPTPWTIALWVKQDDRDAGGGDGGPTTSEREELARLRRENKRFEVGARNTGKSRGLVRPGDRTEFEELFEFVRANQDTYPVGVMCRLLRVSKSGFYAWMKRPMSAHTRADVRLTAVIRAIHEYSKGTYGAPRVHAELVLGQSLHVARKRVCAANARSWAQGRSETSVCAHDSE